ncbi:helix-turn-helix domain-containing protein [Beijerinckia indica]|uniref:Transcriptional regulator, XRE family n=1 Tax=Beijerinckia indica subsp. indica (strain ATCC 9039 / DSM 1715 / NCIMB 8712) TaxID=395963 RepID=B2IHY7_BEII9|nr:helix-turn-helix transcriptional regulator [Beijerinckia indica]ACB96030.1 transcriptional regulator, XRE family [Beijerinckia indica subsp. indica ATCC 9039]
MVNNLKKIRNRLGLTQIQAAEAMGTTKNQLIKLEKGERRLSDVWIDRAAKAYGVDPGELVSERMEGAITRLDNQMARSLNESLGRDETIAMLQGILSAFLQSESKVCAAAETILTVAENQPSGSRDIDRINNIRTSALISIRLFLPAEQK